MYILTSRENGTYKLGVKRGDTAYAVTMTPGEFFERGLDALPELRQQAEDSTTLLSENSVGPCVPNPGKIICVGQNYRQHAIEANMEIPETPVLFSKFNNALAAPGDPIPLPANAVEYDYEAELAVVIGKRARYISVEDALDYVLGYASANDFSARDLQFTTSQWLLGKTPDRFFPLGPYLVTADEAGDPADMSVRCWLNGELRQNSNTADMIFSVAEIISYTSQYMTLEPGDVISTGTPEGVILGMDPKVWVKPGDEMTVEIGNLGRLTNKAVTEG